MTSTPAPGPASPGNCVVCGKETWTRCSACSENGLDWMFFCSIEHQKLIWFMHKRVCGKNGNPFRWPGFEQEEIDDIISFANKPCMLGGKTELSCFSETLCRRYQMGKDKKLTDVELASFLHRLGPIEESRALSPLDKARRLTVPLTRALADETSVFAAHHERPAQSIQSLNFEMLEYAPFNAMAAQMYTKIGILSVDYERTSWFTKHNHLYLIYFAVGYRHSHAAGPAALEMLRNLVYTSKNLQKFYETIVAETHPKEARSLTSTLFAITPH